ncbi:hypothetical protein C1X73_15540 [Pseudomonas sp. FW305-130]|jgi:hypothetical protein|nr:hypothetical protein L483_05515 [Pseudomonas putida H8234]PNA95710.1 hypothetical protein C1X74_17980 [Pseudomonas sp. GW460-5]PNB57874.1 hypothetical protein C1X73_15540 [Pseudomonas sp. FW305-130]QDY35037.1 hypothetical protein CHR26_01790 [Pseudomonas putida]
MMILQKAQALILAAPMRSSAARAALDLMGAARLRASTPVALTVSFPHNPATDIERRRDWGDL